VVEPVGADVGSVQWPTHAIKDIVMSLNEILLLVVIANRVAHTPTF